MKRTLPILPVPSVTPGSTAFIWATGIEDTFISQPDAVTGRILDEYALTQHYEQWDTDLALIASLGVCATRYGIPWYRVEPRRGHYDWSWTDKVLDTLVNVHNIEPIIDLMHYGTPSWLEGSFLNPDYPASVAAYSRAFAHRYKGLCFWYTPLNEPRVNAWYAAKLGWWPPYRRSWTDFARMLVTLSRGIVETQRAITEVEPNAVFVHVDATDLYLTSEPELQAEAELRQEIVFCALDLVQGKVQEHNLLHSWLAQRGIAANDLDWFQQNHVRPDIIGYNMYPMFSEKHLLKSNRGVEVRIRRCGGETFMELTRMYADRYALPVMCTETASNGPPARRVRWIEETAIQIHKMRANSVPVVGYTYWPLFSLVTWAYQRGKLPPDRYLAHMGLWDLRKEDTSDLLRRIPTSAVAAYRQRSASSVAPLATRSQCAPMG